VILSHENSELKNEVIALAKEFGLVTPYTSYLVKEEEMITFREGDARRMNAPQAVPGLLHETASAPSMMDAMQQSSGAGAVQMSKSIQAMRSADVATAGELQSPGLVAIRGSNFRQQPDGTWMDVECKAGTTTIKLAFASEAYFNFLRAFPEAREFCKLGNKVIFKFRGKFVQIGENGEKQMSEAKWRELFR
jgi:Ca-activated chloride channel family protein